MGFGVFAVFAAPVVLSGRATFVGYMKLDDTSTYLAMTDRMMEHGRSLAGLAPSTYEATLATTLAIGYPTGSLMPLGIGHQLLAYDSAWLYQPYLAFLAAMLALALYAVLGRVVASAPLRALGAFLAAQPAILYGYALWGGIKEVAGALLLALISALLLGRSSRSAARAPRSRWRRRPRQWSACSACRARSGSFRRCSSPRSSCCGGPPADSSSRRAPSSPPWPSSPCPRSSQRSTGCRASATSARSPTSGT
jgi:hypothetical protein